VANREYRPISTIPPHRVVLFWSRVTVGSPDECWLWTHRFCARGYGVFIIDDKDVIASRVAYYLYYGIDPTGKLVCHKCDNPPCCNPAHLFLGTDADNVHDMLAKGRASVGEKHYAHINPERSPARILTREQVLQIRALRKLTGRSHKSIAKDFGVCRTAIVAVINRRTWKHI
jgi:HNH endonuclease